MFKEFKKLFKHTLVYGLGNILSRAVGFLLIPLYTRCLLPKDYGMLEILSLTATMAGIFIGMGLSSATLRFYFEYDQEKDRRQVISTSFITSTIIVFVAVLLLSRFSSYFSQFFFHSPTYAYFFNLTFLTMFFDTTSEIPFAFVRAKERSGTFVMISLAKLIVALTLTIYTVAYLKMGILGVLISNLAAMAICWILLALITLKYSGLMLSTKKLAEVVRYGTPLILVSLGLFLLNSADRFFLNRYSTLTAVGLYSLGFRFGIILRFLIVEPFMAGYSPYRFFIMKKNNAKEIYARVLTYISFLLLFVGLFIAVLIKEIITVMASPAFYDAYKVVPIIILGVICYGAYFICQIGIYIQKETRSIAYIVMAVAILSLFLNRLSIPRFGMMGAAGVSFLSYLLLTLITNFVSQKYYPIKYEYGRLAKMVAVAALFYFLSILVNTPNLLLSFAIKFLIICLFPISLLLVNFYNDGEKRILKEKIFIPFKKYVLLKEVV